MPEPYFHPDKIILLTVNEKEQQKRLGIQTDKNWDRKQEVWKSQGLELQEKLNRAYLKVAKDYNISTIDASGTIEEVHAEICRSLGIESLGSVLVKDAALNDVELDKSSAVGELRVV